MCSPPKSRDHPAPPCHRLTRLLCDLPDDLTVKPAAGSPEMGVEVRDVTLDSRTASPGSLFCCIAGSVDDGHAHAAEALARGATAVLSEHDIPGLALPPGTVELRVPAGSARRAAAYLAAAFWGHPSRRIRLAGVTGTNGKTTVTHLVRSIFEAHGWPSVLIGTLGGARTTPEAPVLQRILAGALAEGKAAAVMEVSSHALDQHRVDGCRFDVAAFTNLSHDHLDYHGSMEAYFAAKRRLFTPPLAKSAVVAVDDAWGQRLAAEIQAGGFPCRRVSRDDASSVQVTAGSISMTWRGARASLRLGGEMNLANALIAAGIAEELGIPPETVAAGLDAAGPVPGRFEVVVAGPPVTVVVDYAHTPAGLEAALGAARAASSAGVVAVFGCGGDRDRAKRPLMGAVAGRLADVAVLTSDNSRSEDPLAIIEEVAAGAAGGAARLVVEADRRAAIARALDSARPGDVVVVAGKGHETELVGPAGAVSFDDRAVVAADAAARGWELAGEPAGVGL